MITMKKTPLLESSVESLVHGVEHYFLKYGRSNKFTLLHIDQAVELLLKAKIQSINGLSIYTKKGKTIDYHECFSKLKDLDIPEKSLLEEIHEKRNLSQHLGSSFDDYSVGYYVKFVYFFFKFFLEKEFNEKLDDYLSDDIKTYINNITIEPTRIHENQLKYIENLIEQGKYEQSIIASWNAVEFLIKGYSDKNIGKSIDDIIKSIKDRKIVEKKDLDNLNYLKTLKDSITFSDSEVDLEAVTKAQKDVIDITNSSIVIVPVKTPQKIKKMQISTDENAEPVRVIDDTTPVENEQELFFVNLKLYKSDNKYISDFDSILKLYNARFQLEIDENEGYELLIQSAIFHNLPCWYWARKLTEDNITEIIERNSESWKYPHLYYSLDVLLLLSNQKSNEILIKLTNDYRTNIVKKSNQILSLRKDLMAILDYTGANKLKELERIKRINLDYNSLPKPFSVKIINQRSEKTSVIKILKQENWFEILMEYFNQGNNEMRKTILDALSYIKDEKSLLFYMKCINDHDDYIMYREIILKLDKAIYCPKIN